MTVYWCNKWWIIHIVEDIVAFWCVMHLFISASHVRRGDAGVRHAPCSDDTGALITRYLSPVSPQAILLHVET